MVIPIPARRAHPQPQGDTILVRHESQKEGRNILQVESASTPKI